jgi:hypothetical protein
MPQGYEVEDGKGGRAWWDGKKLTPMNESGFTVAGPGRTTEGERTAGFLASRAADSAKNLSTIGQRNPNANKPNLFEAAATAANAPGIANALRGGDRQQVYANQLDLLDAALTLGTGAAYTREQLNNYRDTYFPGLTDKPETVKAKRQKLLSLLEAAKIKAGGAAPPSLDEAIGQMRGPQGASMENPFALTEKNRSAIPEGSYFKAGDGKVYRQQKGAGFPGKGGGGKTGAAAMSDDEIKRMLGL